MVLADAAAWFRDYSGALSAGAAIVLVAVTIVYVVISGRLARHSKAQLDEAIYSRLDSRMPNLSLQVNATLWIDRNDVRIILVASNYGPGVARILVKPPSEWVDEAVEGDGPTAPIRHLVIAPDKAESVYWYAPNEPAEFLLEVFAEPVASDVLDHYHWRYRYDPPEGQPHGGVDLTWEHLRHLERRYGPSAKAF